MSGLNGKVTVEQYLSELPFFPIYLIKLYVKENNKIY